MVSRCKQHATTIAYVERRKRQSKNVREAIRYLKLDY